ncbi:GTPase domain-containing protein [Novosphingobium sp. B-7]|uniref:TRAFAC clade GTPase domain-containing protein n=1 Tax=Novosphingobium sp. B-7 TaxID=1298855 RepID=UPI0003B5F0F0|nr:GTPase domain-containing protein [Novosphingobium sp. B-7]
MDLRAFTCSQNGCDGPRSGICINTLPFDECPDVIRAEDVEDEEAQPEQAGSADHQAEMDMVVTPGGRSLTAERCDALLRERGGVVIGIVAGPAVGKTTLIGTIYELIHRARMKDFGFAGSETLRGYEERTFLARMASKKTKPDTPRTRHELTFTHLRIATGHGKTDVFFADRPGENFDVALGQTKDFATFTELARSTVILLMVDLKELMEKPQPIMSSIRRLFMAMEQHGSLANKRLFLLGTKADLLTADGQRDAAVLRLEQMRSDLETRSSTGAKPITVVVSSRAPKGTNRVGEGVEQLLSEILQPLPPSPFTLGSTSPSTPTALDSLMVAMRRKHS